MLYLVALVASLVLGLLLGHVLSIALMRAVVQREVNVVRDDVGRLFARLQRTPAAPTPVKTVSPVVKADGIDFGG